jgi:hypothetical protein
MSRIDEPVAEYQLVASLPETRKTDLPTIEQIKRELQEGRP